MEDVKNYPAPWTQLEGTAIWEQARSKMAEDPRRIYHTWEHILRLYGWAQEFGLPYSRALDLAILCHDVIWDEKGDNELRSIQWMMQHLPDNDPDAGRAALYIETTITHEIGEGCELLVLDLADFLKPDLAVQMSDEVVLEHSIFFNKSAVASAQSCQSYLERLAVSFQIPDGVEIPQVLQEAVPQIRAGMNSCAKAMDSSINPVRQTDTPDLPADLACLSQEMHGALMTYFPEYLEMNAAEREGWRASRDPNIVEVRSQIRYHLLINHFGVAIDEIEAPTGPNDFLHLDQKTQHAINLEMQSIEGIGRDMITLSDEMPGVGSCIDFETIGAFYEKICNHTGEHLPKEERDASRSYVNESWAYIIKDGDLKYVTLHSYAYFEAAMLGYMRSAVLQELVPHTYGGSLGPITPKGRSYLIRLDAGGKEDLLEALRKLSGLYISYNFEKALRGPKPHHKGVVWTFNAHSLFRKTAPDMQNFNVVFADAQAMDNVRLKHFMEDCATHAGDPADLKCAIDVELEAFEAFLRKTHAVFVADPAKIKRVQKERMSLETMEELAT